MRKRRLILVLSIVAAAMLALVLAAPFLIDANQFRPAIESELTKSLGREVKIGALNLNILSGTVTVSDLSVADDPSFSQTAFLRAKALTLSIDLWQALFSRRLSVNGVTLETPAAVLIQLPSGRWNFSSLGPKASAQPQPAGSSSGQMALSVKSLKINGARLSLTQGGGKPQLLDNVSIEVKEFAPGSAFPFTLSAKVASGGTVALDGKAGPLDPSDAANTPLAASLKIANLNLAASGAVPDSSGIDGVVSVDGSVSSNGNTLEATGKLKAEKLTLTKGAPAARDPLLFDFSLAEDLKQHSGQMTRGDIAIGGVKASLTGTWTQQGETPVLSMILSAPAVPVSALAQLLPALNIVLPAGSAPEGGTATAKLALSGPASVMVVSGPVSVRDTRLKGFDLGAKMSAIEKLAGLKSGPTTEIQSLSANLRITPAETRLQDIHLVLPSVGELTGAGTIGSAHALDFRMRATLRAGALVSVLAPSNIPFSIEGTASDPQFRPDVGALAGAEITRGLSGVKVGGVDAGKAADSLVQGLFGGKKKK
jgi:AsmA protein